MNHNSTDQETRKINWELFLPGILFLAFSLYFAYGMYTSHQQQADASANYVTVKAKILDGLVSQTTISTPTTTGNTKIYLPRIHYEYEVDGRTYQSKRFNYFGKGYDSTQDAQEIVDRYPVGSIQSAYYNPGNPSEAVLHKSMSASTDWAAIFIPTLFVVVGFLAVFGGWRGWLRGLRK